MRLLNFAPPVVTTGAFWQSNKGGSFHARSWFPGLQKKNISSNKTVRKFRLDKNNQPCVLHFYQSLLILRLVVFLLELLMEAASWSPSSTLSNSRMNLNRLRNSFHMRYQPKNTAKSKIRKVPIKVRDDFRVSGSSIVFDDPFLLVTHLNLTFSFLGN